MSGDRTRRLRALAAFVVALGVILSGCAGYTAGLRDAKRSVVSGRVEQGVTELNEAIGVDREGEIPAKLTGENTLTLLERATLLQALGRYELSARDMMLADQQLDWLDIAAQGKAKVGKYLYSGSSVKYRAPPHERLMLNALNMLNFLALRDFEGAKVEARRFSIIEHFFVGNDAYAILPETVAFGNYLGGVAFEAAGDYETAARYYTKAWHYGIRYDRLRDRLVALCRLVGYSPTELVDLESEALDQLDSRVDGGEAPSFETYRRRYVDGEVLVVTQTGLVPYKEPKRFPLAKALTYSAAHAYAGIYVLSSVERQRARELAVSGALKWVNFPVLSNKGLPPTRSVRLAVDGRSQDLKAGVNIERQTEYSWERTSGSLMGAAISRMITRAVAGAATREGVEAATRESEGSSIFGLLAQLAVEGGMTAADKPDTRSWSMLPARIRFRRLSLEPGTHSIRASIDGRRLERRVEVHERGPTTVNFSKFR